MLFSTTYPHQNQTHKEHITLVLIALHWLPIHFKFDLKHLLLGIKALNGQASEYISDMLIKFALRTDLRSSNAELLVVPIRTKTFGHAAFCVAGPRLWNSLPLGFEYQVQ